MSVRDPARGMSPIEWFCLLAFSAASPFVFILVAGFAGRAVGPVLSVFDISAPTPLAVVLFALIILGALCAGAIVGFPLGRLAPRRALALGAVVGVVGAAAVAWLGRAVPPEGVALWALRITELGAYIGGCMLFALVGAKRMHRVAA